MPVIRNNSKKVKDLRDKIKDNCCTCFFCGEFIERELRTIDHLLSLAKGGDDSEDNMVVSCRQCNNEKSDLSIEEYIKLKLEGFDFKARAEENKKKRGFGYEGAIYEEFIIPINQLISRPLTAPSLANIEKRKRIYLEQKIFIKPTYVRKKGNKYIILQGFINYIIAKECNLLYMPVVVVRDNTKNKNSYKAKNKAK